MSVSFLQNLTAHSRRRSHSFAPVTAIQSLESRELLSATTVAASHKAVDPTITVPPNWAGDWTISNDILGTGTAQIIQNGKTGEITIRFDSDLSFGFSGNIKISGKGVLKTKIVSGVEEFWKGKMKVAVQFTDPDSFVGTAKVPKQGLATFTGNRTINV